MSGTNFLRCSMFSKAGLQLLIFTTQHRSIARKEVPSTIYSIKWIAPRHFCNFSYKFLNTSRTLYPFPSPSSSRLSHKATGQHQHTHSKARELQFTAWVKPAEKNTDKQNHEMIQKH